MQEIPHIPIIFIDFHHSGVNVIDSCPFIRSRKFC